MMHPHTELRFISDQIGFGVFTTADIPKGTLVYVKDQFELKLSQRAFAALDSHRKAVFEKYSYTDERGMLIFSWDHAKYVNHRCDCNAMSTGYGFEIAIRDIPAGEEITDEYGLFNIAVDIDIACGCHECRLVIRPSDIDFYHETWDAKIIDALSCYRAVSQPLHDLIDSGAKNMLTEYLDGNAAYRSVLALKKNQPAGKQVRSAAARKTSGRSRKCTALE